MRYYHFWFALSVISWLCGIILFIVLPFLFINKGFSCWLTSLVYLLGSLVSIRCGLDYHEIYKEEQSKS